MSSIYKVERKVDTVIIEMDISVAEQVNEILNLVQDNTRMGNSHYGSSINDLRVRLAEEADVRAPSPLYVAVPQFGYTELRDVL